MKHRLAFLLLAALAMPACDDTSSSPTPLASPSPSPSPSASPVVDACKVRRADLFVERQDPPHVGDIVEAWPTGVVPIVHVLEKFAGQFVTPPLPVDQCPQVDKHTWGFDGASEARCVLLGNETAPARPVQCFTTGFVTILSQPQGIDVEPARATFRIQPGDAALVPMTPDLVALWEAQTARGDAMLAAAAGRR